MATQEVRIKELILAVATDWQNIWAKIGLGTLDTTATDLIEAINEVKETADAAVSGTAPDATESVKGIVELATTGEVVTGTDTTRVATPAGVDAALDARVVDASDTVKGIVELATNAETVTGTDTGRATTPAGVDAALDARIVASSATVAGIVELASDAEALALSATDRALTPGNLGAITNVNNGIAKLDASGKVAAAQLPGFVDDILEVANFAALPGTGTTGILYVTLDNNKTWRWSGSAYVEVSPSPGTTDSLAEGSTNLYFTNTRADTRADGRITALIGDTDEDYAAYYAAAKA